MEDDKNEHGLRWLWWLVLAVAFYLLCPKIWCWPIVMIYGDGLPQWVEVIGMPAEWLYDHLPAYEAWIDLTMEKMGLR